MKEQPVIELERIILRPFSFADAKEVQSLAGEEAVDRTTLNIPHPYLDGMAEQWIGTHKSDFENCKGAVFAIVLKGSQKLCGAIGLSSIDMHYERAELGYWIGVPYWGQGYCTEAAKEVVRFGFEDLKLNRIYAQYFSANTASGRVMQKIGMQREGCLRQHVKKYDKFMDIVCYAILKDEWKEQN
ncbi:MAG: GNAT family N-acetyltransferase [Clostridiales bacterium]